MENNSGYLRNEIIEDSIIIDKSKFEKQFNIYFNNKTEIYKVYELSNKRIAILDNEEKEMKIYSLKTGNLINKITQEYIRNIIELNNKDLVINSSSKIYLYKLLKDQNYELYQIIDEYEQKTYTTKRYGGFLRIKKRIDEKYYKLNSIYQLINGDLVSCNSYGIKIYKKDNDGNYKLSLIEKIKGEIENAIELKENVLFLFRRYYDRPTTSFFCEIFEIYKYDIEKKELIKLSGNNVRDVDFYSCLEYFTYLVNNNYLFVRYGLMVEVYNKDAELIYEFFYDKFGKNDLPIKELYCNYNNNIFIAKNGNDKIKMF